MINNKTSLFIIFGLLMIIRCSPKELPTIFNFGGKEAKVLFSHETTNEEMKLIADSLSKYGVTLDITGSTFFENNRLQNLKLQVILPNNKTGVTSADAVSLQFSYYGFLIREDGYFKIGSFNPNEI